MTSPHLVRLRGITKSYKRGALLVPVLKELDLDIPHGAFLALMGPSGSGKSTLLNLIAGLDKPDHGSIVVGEREITLLDESELTRWRARHVGFIFQFYNLIPVLTALENVELPLLLGSLTARERKERATQALVDVGLSQRLDHYPAQLSGGEQQRVAIARAIINSPTLIVADEPTGDLDDRSAQDFLSLLGRMNRSLGKTVLMVTHDPRAARCAQATLHLDKGRLHADSGERASDMIAPNP
jgi:putative ABC transport system ATP-binding protein